VKSFLSNRSSESEPAKAAAPSAQIPSGLSALFGLQVQNRVCNDPRLDSVITCKRDGGVVRTIVVTCSCGKITEIDCHYENASPSKPPA